MFYGSQFFYVRGKAQHQPAISKLLDEFYENFYESRITRGIFLDLFKTFDTINHNILIQKLPYYNFTNKACNLLNSYLSIWAQYVQIDQHKSSLGSVNIGVPRGSVLGPILFIIYISDFVNAAPIFNYILFADDTNILSSDALLLKLNLKTLKIGVMQINEFKTLEKLLKFYSNLQIKLWHCLKIIFSI